MESVVAGVPPVGCAYGHIDLTGKASSRTLSRIIQRVTIRRADDKDIQVSRWMTLLSGIPGSPGSE
jgi:hypothetical protein